MYCFVVIFCNFFMPIIKIIKQFCHYATWYTLSIPAQPLKLKAFSILFFLHCTYFVKITHKNYYLQTQHQGRNRGLRPYDCGLTFILQNRTRRWQQRRSVMVILACPDARAALMAPWSHECFCAFRVIFVKTYVDFMAEFEKNRH